MLSLNIKLAIESEKLMKFSSLATKSVSELISSITAFEALLSITILPSAATLDAFFPL